MKLRPIVTAVTLAAVTNIATASEKGSNSDVERSAAAGFVAGALAGGPLGAFAGTVFGGEVVGRWFQTRRENRELNTALSHIKVVLKEEREEKEALISALNRDLDKLLALKPDANTTTNLPIQFRTASSDIEAQYLADLDKVVRLLNRNRDARVTLSGFADRRGDEKANQVLSEKRVSSVRQYLLSQGVKKDQVLSLAYGESQPLSTDENLEGNFFDRRVLVELNMNLDPQLATR